MINVEVLDLFLHQRRVGQLFRFGNGTASTIVRFVADDAYAADPNAPTLSSSMLANTPEQQESLWKDVANPIFNGTEGRLPNFFQNMLPEGVFRTQLAQLRGCREDDHFALFAATGGDLPGALKALPAHLNREELARLVTQSNDAFEMSVTADPLPFGVSISGMQPKVGLIAQGGRYVARKRHGVTRIIGKLPQIDRPMLPEVEHLSLSMATAAGAKVCEHALISLEKMDMEHGYTLGQSSNFLAVTRFDREAANRIHCEDFAQVFDVDPRNKYTGTTYAAMGAFMMQNPQGLGLGAVHELLRLITINELLGNFDGHAKNFCLLYPDGCTPVLSKAFDIVAWAAYIPGRGNGLAIYRPKEEGGVRVKQPKTLNAESLSEFCQRVRVAEKPCAKLIRDTKAAAAAHWPAMIENSNILDVQKHRILAHLKDALEH